MAKPDDRKKTREENDPEDDDLDDPRDRDRTFSQREMQSIAKREKADGRRSGRRELLEELGVSSVDEAKELVGAARKNEDEAKSEAERAKDQATKDRDAAARQKREAAIERRNAKIERRLLRAGVKEDRLDRALRLLDIDEDDEDVDVKELDRQIKDLREETPTYFESETDDTTDSGDKGQNNQQQQNGQQKQKQTPPPPVTPPPSGVGSSGDKSPMEAAKALLVSRHGDRMQKSNDRSTSQE